MQDVAIGQALRLLRIRARLTQAEAARRAGISQATWSRIERGQVGRAQVDTVRRAFTVVEGRIDITTQWRGGEVERLRDEWHARLEGANVHLLASSGWATTAEVTFSEWGERGSIDVLGTRRDLGAAIVCEDKTKLLSAEETSRRLDVKARLAPEIVLKREGWRPARVSRLLVLESTMTNRRRVAAHATLLDKVFPLRSDEARAWLRRPVGSVSALLFVSSNHGRNGCDGRGGVSSRRSRRVTG